MNLEDLRTFCLSFNDVTEGFPFGPGALVFKTGSKMFALVAIDEVPYTFNVKCDPEIAVSLRDQYPAILPGYHMNKKYWNTVIADGSLTDGQVKQFITDSYNLVKPKRR